MRSVVVAIVAGLAVAATAQGATLKVGPNEAFTDIAAAAAAAVAGDTIQIQKGTYILPATVNFTQPNLTITGKGVIVDGATPGGNDNNVDCFNITGAGTTVQGITFRNGDNQIQASGGTLTITKCTFLDSDGTAVLVTAGNTLTIAGCTFTGGQQAAVNATASNATIQKCKIRSMGNDGILITGDGAVVESNTLNFIDDNTGISVTGDSATVRKNKLYAIGGTGINAVDDNGAVEASFQDVEGNTVTLVDNATGINVTHTLGVNSTVLVQKNKIQDVGGGINVDCDHADVIGNKVTDGHAGTGVTVSSDDMTVTGNTVTLGADDFEAFILDSSSGTGGGLVEKNKAKDVMDAGFYLGDNNGFYNVTVKGCSAMNCGTEDEWGFYIIGDSNTFEKLTVTNVNNTGIELNNGDSNTFTACKVTGALGDGFRMNAGTGNVFVKCSAAKCGAEGFDNRGTLTDLQGGKYQGARFDITNTGTFVDMTLDGVGFSTGGSAQASEVD
jgi:hypothetical protein